MVLFVCLRHDWDKDSNDLSLKIYRVDLYRVDDPDNVEKEGVCVNYKEKPWPFIFYE